MTEAEWLACGDVTFMAPLIHLTDRQRRLFAVACCRKVDHLLTDPRSRAAVTIAERFAEGQASRAELLAARDEATVVLHAQEAGEVAPDAWRPETFAAEAARRACYRDAIEAADFAAGSVSETMPGDRKGVQRILADLMREIGGNPHRLQAVYGRNALDGPRAALNSWRNPTTSSLAQTMYESLNFAAMPILGDALEDAGCTDCDILGHCRQPGEHVRGCWVVDLVLGKA